MKYTLIFIALATLITSCKKEPGIGGDAEIRGQVWSYILNGSLTGFIGDCPAEDTYVYIVYGDNTGFDKRVKTDYNGNFRFPYLYPGEYTLYVYSVDTSADSFDSQRPIIKKVTIQKRKEIIELDRFEIMSLQP
jgi:hypothetical protein